MHQTFYIDADEEISSVIDRLRKSMAVDNYFIAPKRAIFLQSIVNLKLLKREAEKIKKHVILVTQEEIVVAMAVRSGISVQQSIDGLGEALDVEQDNDYDALETEEVMVKTKHQDNKSVRLKNVGSTNFYDSQLSTDIYQQKPMPKDRGIKSITTKATHFRKNVTTVNHAGAEKYPAENVSERRISELSSRGKIPIFSSENSRKNGMNFNRNEDFKNLSPGKEKKIEKMFSQKEEENRNSDDSRQLPNRKTKNVLFVFVLLCLILLAGVAGYLYVPSADVSIKPNVQTIKIDVDINAKQSFESDASLKNENAISLRAINQDQQLTSQYNSTGKSSSSGKKAQGTVVIYNEFDSHPQTLVASTRIQSESGKVFRLLKTIIVPGLTSVSGETKPGVISAEVMADQSGSEYNIEVTNFKIPGFQGGSKYDKFYAKSSSTMSGGTTEGNASVGVSQDDLNSAKQKTEVALKEKITSAILAETTPNEMVLAQAEKITPGKSFASAKVGDGVESFEYTATANVVALVFSQEDVRAIIKKTTQFIDQPRDAEKNIKNLEYVSVEPSFENDTITLKVHADIEVTPKIDLENLKKDLLGKNENEMTELLRKNQNTVIGANVNFWPTFINRIPQFSQKVKIEVEKAQ